MRNMPLRYTWICVLFITILSCHKDKTSPESPSNPDTTTVPQNDLPAVDNTIPSLTITWDATARKISHDVGYAEYGRVHRINGDTLLLTYHCGPNVSNFFGVDIALRRSVDNGKTWSKAEIVVNGPQPDYYGFQNPETLELNNGWILLAFVGRGKPDNNANDNVQLCISKDRGITWSDPMIIAAGRSWEPGMVQLPDGTVDLFYSSEAAWFPSNDVQQDILMINSSDNGLTWTSPKQVSYSPGNRDGMAVPIVLNDNKGIVFSIESVGNSQSPWVVWSSLDANFNYESYSTVQNGRRWLVTPNNIHAGASYLIQLPTGQTILSCQYSGGRAIGSNWKKSTMAVFVGNSVAMHFTNISYPWPNLSTDEGAYFSSLFLKNDNTIVLVTTRSFADGHSEIWWKEGHLDY